MNRTADERIETSDPRDDQPTPGPELDTHVEVGGGDVLIPDDDDDEEVKPDEAGELGRAAVAAS